MNIVRIDQASRPGHGTTAGWQARIPLGNGTRFTKFFADHKHGGEQKAYRLAAEWLGW